ncbi:MAG: DUF1326 domain-containing protein [Actinobacteria bacterium]|nr:DUF1326 domain-containing protein [Actinomycetota bacterium]
MATTWNLDGYYVMGCNCDYGCPCNFNARPSPGHCEGVMGFTVEKGDYEGVDISGISALAMVWWPAAIHEGNGRTIIFVDDSKGKDKAEALGKIIAGEAGGPMAIFRNTWSKIEGPHATKVKATVNGKDSSISVEGVGGLAFDSIKNPVTGAEGFPRVVLPQGLLTNELEQFTTKEFSFESGDMSVSFPGKTAQVAKIAWSG